MTSSEANGGGELPVTTFGKFEYDNGLFARTIRGVDWWSFVRDLAYKRIFRALQGGSRERLMGVVQPPTFGSLVSSSFGRHSIRRLGKADLLFINGRRFRAGGAFKCVYGHDFLQALTVSHVTLEHPRPAHSKPPLPGSPLCYTDYLYVAALLRAGLGAARRPRVRPAELDEVRDVERALTDLFGIEPGLDLTPVVRDTVAWYGEIERAWHWVLRRVQPRAVVLLAHLYRPHQILIRICRELGIPAAELQHGVMDDACYNYPSGVSVPSFPDRMFVFGDFWKEVTSLPVGPERVTAVGFPFFENRIRALRGAGRPSGGRRIVVVGNASMDRQLLEVAKAARAAAPDLTLVYRPHPTFPIPPDVSESLIKDSVHAVEDRRSDPYESLLAADGVLTGPTSLIFEALRLNVRVFLFAPAMTRPIQRLIALDAVTVVTGAPALIQGLERNVQIPNQRFFWEDPTPERIRSAVDELMAARSAAS